MITGILMRRASSKVPHEEKDWKAYVENDRVFVEFGRTGRKLAKKEIGIKKFFGGADYAGGRAARHLQSMIEEKEKEGYKVVWTTTDDDPQKERGTPPEESGDNHVAVQFKYEDDQGPQLFLPLLYEAVEASNGFLQWGNDVGSLDETLAKSVSKDHGKHSIEVLVGGTRLTFWINAKSLLTAHFERDAIPYKALIVMALGSNFPARAVFVDNDANAIHPSEELAQWGGIPPELLELAYVFGAAIKKIQYAPLKNHHGQVVESVVF